MKQDYTFRRKKKQLSLHVDQGCTFSENSVCKMSSKQKEKRVSRLVKQHSDKTKTTRDDDEMVKKILEQMNIDITSPRTTRGMRKKQLKKDPKMPKLKKILPLKRHPLMEKCQKNLKYIKHNRRMDKPRAHVGGRFESTSSSVHKRLTKQQTSTFESGTDINSRKPNRLKDIDIFGDSQSDASYKPKRSRKKISYKIPDSNSDSEFESFILQQKDDSDDSEVDYSKTLKHRTKGARKSADSELLNQNKDDSNDSEADSTDTSKHKKRKKYLKKDKHRDKNKDKTKKKSALPQRGGVTSSHSTTKLRKGKKDESDLSDSETDSTKINLVKSHRRSKTDFKQLYNRLIDESNLSESEVEIQKSKNKMNRVGFKNCAKMPIKRKYVESESSDSVCKTITSNSNKNCKGYKASFEVRNQIKYIENDSSDSDTDSLKSIDINYNNNEKLRDTSCEELVTKNKEINLLINDKEKPSDSIIELVTEHDLPCTGLKQNCELKATVATASKAKLDMLNSDEIQKATNNEEIIDSDDDCVLIGSDGSPEVEKIVEVPSLRVLNSDKTQNSTTKEDIADSDDDCMIVMEVPKSDTLYLQPNNIESSEINCDIKILNVTSLLESSNVDATNETGQDTNFVTQAYTQKLTDAYGNLNQLFNEIDCDHLKEMIKKCSSQKSEEVSEFNRTDCNTDYPSYLRDTKYDCQMQTDVENNCKESFSSAFDALRTVSKLDLKQILSSVSSAANKADISLPSEDSSSSIPCSSKSVEVNTSYLDGFGTFIKNKIANNSVFQNASNTETRNIYPQNIPPEDILSTFSSNPIEFDKCENGAEFNKMSSNELNYKTTEPFGGTNGDVSLSSQNDILSNNQRSGMENFQACCRNKMEGQSCGTIKNESNYYPSVEFDFLATTYLKNGNCPNAVIKNLLELYARKLQEYNALKAAERYTSAKLQTIADSHAHGVSQLELAIQHFSNLTRSETEYGHRSIENSCQKINTNSTGNLEKYDETKFKCRDVKNQVCDNCGAEAVIQCVGCNKVFFCSEKCGVSYWKNGHGVQCSSNLL